MRLSTKYLAFVACLVFLAATAKAQQAQTVLDKTGSTVGTNSLTWNRLGAVLGTPFSTGVSSIQEPSCFVQTSPQVLNANYSQVVGCLYTFESSISYAEAPTPQGPFTVFGSVLGNTGCASNVLTIAGQLVMFACSVRTDIHRYHSTTHGISWVDDGAVITHNAQAWYSAAVNNSSILIIGSTCYLWFDGTTGNQVYQQGLYTGNSTCAVGSFTETAGDPVIPSTEMDGGGPFVYNDGTNFWQWELGQTGTAIAFPTWIYFSQLNTNGAGTPSPHTHALVITPKGADEGFNNTTNAGFNAQVADPFLLEWPYTQGDIRNSTYMYYSSCAGNCNSPNAQEFSLKVAIIPLPMKSIVQMTQVDTAANYNYVGWLFTNGISSNTQLPESAIFDNGNRPDSTNTPFMGQDWTAVYGNSLAQIVSKKFEPVSSGSRPLHLRVQPTADQFSAVQLIAAASTSTIGSIIRGSPTAVTLYECVTVNALGSSQTMVIRKFVNGAGPTTVASAVSVTPRANDWMVFTAQGSTLTCTVYDTAGNITISGTDTAIATGLPGMTIVDATPANAILANWSGGSINGAGSAATQQSQIWPTAQQFQQASAVTQTSGDNTDKVATDKFVIANAGTGSPPVTTVAAGPLTATQSITTLCASATCTTGTYRVDWVFWGSGTACSSVTAGQVTLAFTWKDKNAVTHSGVLMQMQTQTSATAVTNQANFHFETALANEGSSGVYVLNTDGSANVQYTMTYTACTTGTGTYNFTAAVTRLQ